MAKLSPEEAQSLAAVFSRMKNDSVEAEARLQSMLSTQGKGLRKLQRQFKKLRVTNIQEIRKSEAAVKSLVDRWEEATEAERKQLPILKQSIREHKNANKAMNKLAEGASSVSQGISSIGRELNKMIAPLRRYISLTGILSAAIDGAISIYRRWTDLQTRTTAAMGEASRMLGGTADQMQAFQSRAEGLTDTFSYLDEDVTGIAGSFQHVREVSLALRTSIDSLGEGVEAAMLRTARGFGIGNENAALLFRMIEQGVVDSASSLDEFGANMLDFAESIGANGAQLVSQFVESRNVIAEFGREGEQVFQNAAMMANEFGFETRRVLESMRGFDTFRGASQSVNQLNAMLGTTLSSYEMMLEQDPTARLEMLRSSLDNAGHSWDSMNRMQRRALSEASGFDENELSLMLGADARSFEQMREEQRKAAEEQAALADRRQSAESIMTDLLMRTSRVWDTIGRQIERIMNAVATDLAPIFEEIHTQAELIGGDLWDWITGLTGTSDAAGFAKQIAEWIREIGTTIRTELPVYLARVQTIWASWQPMIQQAKNWIIELVERVQSYDFGKLWDDILITWREWEPYLVRGRNLLADIMQTAADGYDTMVDIWNSTPIQMFISALRGVGMGFSFIFRTITSGVGQIISGIGTMGSSIARAISPITDVMGPAAGEYFSNLTRGIGAGGRGIGTSLENMGQGASRAAQWADNGRIMARGAGQQATAAAGKAGRVANFHATRAFNVGRSAVASAPSVARTVQAEAQGAARGALVEFRNIPVVIEMGGRELGRGIVEAAMRTN